MNLRKYIRSILSEAIQKESLKSDSLLIESESNLILFHGSSTDKPITTIYDNQFYTAVDTIAASYAFNKGGLLYKVSVSKLNPFEIKEDDNRMTRLNSGPLLSGSDKFWYDIFYELYGKNTADYFSEVGFVYGLGKVVNGDVGPLIKLAKSKGYDSLKFMDESFDVSIVGMSYVIFDGSKAKIKNVYEIDMTKDGYAFTYKNIKETSSK
jgi:hypothetical protein